MTAPSMTTPALTYFHSATSSFRASATSAVLRIRSRLRSTRWWNQRVGAECGWRSVLRGGRLERQMLK